MRHIVALRGDVPPAAAAMSRIPRVIPNAADLVAGAAPGRRFRDFGGGLSGSASGFCVQSRGRTWTI